jgi:predicted GNAT family N-acyltransferase
MNEYPLTVSIINGNSAKYEEMLELRDEILRRPLGLSVKTDDNSRDFTDPIFIGEYDNKIIACLLLQDQGNHEARLRLMAVGAGWQGKGIGRQLVQAAEQYAWQQGYHKIILHARQVALGFYLSMGYIITSDEFTEVGIPHYMMEKVASPRPSPGEREM